MLADGRTVPGGEVVTTDVCVIGAGPAGITVARHLGAAGFDVLLLERGGRGSLRGAMADPDTAVSVGAPYHLAQSRLFALGGAVHRWRADTPLGGGFGRFRGLDAADFEKREWITHSGWPVGKEDLQPFYRRARSLFPVAWPSDRLEETWDNLLQQTPFFDGSPAVQVRVFYFVNPGLFPGELKRELENSERVLVLTDSIVTEIRCDDSSSSSVSSLRVMTAPNHAYTVEARVYVLAAGGIENPRLLLASNGRHPKGLANGHDLVGRFFMEHPHYASGQLIPRSPEMFDDASNHAIHLNDGIPIQKKYALTEDLVQREELTRCVFRFDSTPVTESVNNLRHSEQAVHSLKAAGELRRAIARRQWSSGTSRQLARAIRGIHHIGRHGVNLSVVGAGRRLGLRRYTQPQMFVIRAMAEQVPNPNSQVRLGELRDAFGVPMAELDWRLTDQDLMSMRRSQELFGQALLTSGHTRVQSLLGKRELPPALSGGNHHMGTTRMHDSPRGGVVDRHCQVHGISNLYVAGSSVFPTVGYVNPTLTILALALRIADHLGERVRRPVRIDTSDDLTNP